MPTTNVGIETSFASSQPPERTQKVFCKLAERQGFEPWVRRRRTTVFETVPFNHSGISPQRVQGYTFNRKIAKGLFENCFQGKDNAIKNLCYLFISIFICLIISKSIEKLFGLINIAVVPVAKNDDGSGILNQACKNGIITVPPSVMIDNFIVL